MEKVKPGLGTSATFSYAKSYQSPLKKIKNFTDYVSGCKIVTKQLKCLRILQIVYLYNKQLFMLLQQDRHWTETWKTVPEQIIR